MSAGSQTNRSCNWACIRFTIHRQFVIRAPIPAITSLVTTEKVAESFNGAGTQLVAQGLMMLG